MSKVVDERVVSMQFDNSHFEKNVKTTMSTLDKLKQSLNLKGSAKALEDVGNAAGKVNLSPLSSGVETVTAKFSALQVMGVTALANLTNSAVDSAKRIVRAFTIDPVKTGFNEYELKMGSIQTIMAGTGESLETVNEYLQELNEYSDKTIYSFKDMTSNIGKFTNAGVSLEKAVLAIKGVSNEAALSGANANEASRAMYNFSQALSAGYVKLIDWKSIENANMATVEFKNQLLQTALEMGELEDAGDGMYRTLNGKLVNATHNFNDTLQEQWMTSDVLIETLGRYASTTTDIGKKASAAATEVKTFSMMMDTLKEAAQSGWAMSWEIIFGDFNEGKSLWTSLSGAIGGVIDKMSDARNAFLRSALGTALTDAGKAVKKINAPLATIQTSVKNITSTMEDLSKIADDVLNGAFGNGAERLRALTDAGYNYYNIQNRVNEKLGDSFRYTDKQIQAQDELLGIQTKAVETTTETVKTVDELTEAEIDNIVALSKLGDEQLRSMGYSNKQISAFRELKSVSEHYGVTLKELLTLGDKFNGRWLLIDSFKNIGNAISKVFGGIGKAWESQWGDVDAVAGVQNMLASLHRFSEGLGDIDDIVDKVTRIAKGVFAFTRIMTSFSTRFALTILDIVRGLLGITKWDILGFLANVSDSIVAVRDAIFFNKSLAIGLDGLAPKVVNAAAAVAEWIRSFGKLPGVQKSIESIKASFKAAFDTILGFFKGEIPIDDFFKRIGEGISKFADKLAVAFPFLSGFINLIKNLINAIKGSDIGKGLFSSITNRFKDAYAAGKNIIDGIMAGLEAGTMGLAQAIAGIGKMLIEVFCTVLGIHSPSRVMIALGMFLIDGLILGILAKNGDLGNTIKNFGKTVSDMFGGALGGVAIDIDKIMATIGEKLKQIDLGKAFSGLIAVVLLAITKNIVEALSVIMKPLVAVSDLLGALTGFFGTLKETVKDVGKAIALETYSKGIVNIAIAITLMVGCVLLITQVVKKSGLTVGNVFAALGVIVASGAILWAMAALVSKLGKSSLDITKEGVQLRAMMPKMMSIALSLLVLAATIKIIADIKPEDATRALNTLVTMMFMLLSAVIVMAAVQNKFTRFSPSLMGKMLKQLIVSLLLMALLIKIVGGLTPGEMVKGAAFMGGFIIFVALLGLASRTGKGQINDFSSMVLKITASMLLLVQVMLIVSLLKIETILKGAAFMIGFTVFLKYLVRAVTVGEGFKAASITGILFGVSFSLFAIAMMCGILDRVSWGGLAKGVVLAAAITVMIRHLVGITRLAPGQTMGKVAATITAMSMAIAIIAGVCIILGLIDENYLKKGIVAVAAISAMLSIMVRQLRFATDAKAGMITLIVTLVVLVSAVALLGTLKTTTLLTSVGSLIALMLALAVMLRLLKGIKMDKVIVGNIVLVVAIMAALGGIVAVMSRIGKPEGMIPVAVGITGLLFVLLGAMKVLSLFSKGGVAINASILPSIGIMALLIGGVGLIVANLSKIAYADSVIPTAIAIGILMGAMAIVMQVISGITVSPGKVLTNIALLTAMVAPIIAFALVLNEIPMERIAGRKEALLTIAATMAAMTVLLLAVSGVGALVRVMGGGMKAGLIGLTILCGELALFALALNSIKMGKIASRRKAILTVVQVMVAMTGLLLAVSVIGLLAIGAIPGIIMLTRMCVLFSLFAVALNIIPMDEISRKRNAIMLVTSVMQAMTGLLLTFTDVGLKCIGAIPGLILLTTMCGLFEAFALSLALIPMDKVAENGMTIMLLVDVMVMFVALLTQLSKVGPMAVFGVTALAALEALVVATGTFATAVGALNKLTKGALKDFVTNGLGIMITLAEGLGEFIGSFIGASTSNLPEVGSNLSQFMAGAETFITKVKKCDAKTVTGVGFLGASILALTATNFLDSIATFFGLAPDFSSLGDKLSGFMKGAGPFIDGVCKMDQNAVNGTQALVDTLKVLTKDNFTTDLDKVDMDIINTKLTGLGEAMKTFNGALGTGINPDNFKAAKTAVETMSELEELLPKIKPDENVMASVYGTATTNSIELFAEKMKTFGAAVVSIQESFGDTTLDVSLFENMKTAGMEINDLQTALPEQGGVWEKIAGEKDIAKFGRKLSAFATSMSNFQNTLTAEGFTFNSQLFTDAATAGHAINDLQTALPEQGGVWQNIAGAQDIQEFGVKIVAFAKALITFQEEVAPNGTSVINTTLAHDVKSMGLILSSLQENLPESEGLIQKVKSWFTGGDMTLNDFSTVMVKLGEAIAEFAEKTADVNSADLTTFAESTNTISKALKTLSEIESDSVKEAINANKELVEFITSLKGLDTSGVDTFKTAMGNLGNTEINKFVSAFSKSSSSVNKAGDDLMTNLVSGVKSGKSKIETAGETIIKAFKDKIANVKGLITAGGKLSNKVIEGIKNKRSGFESAATYLAEGLIIGLKAKETQQAVYDAGKELGKKAVQGELDGQRSASPSKATIQAGKWLGEGLVIGIDRMGKAVYNAGYGMGDVATDSISNAITRISDVVSSDIDAQPTIRPVLDLTDVTSGVNQMGSLFNNNPAVGVLARVNGINSAMSGYGQNRGNKDVVSAINKLNDKLDNVGNTYNTISGVTYDDGSGISDAVETLVRYANIERRV